MTIMITQVKQQLAIVKLKYEWKIEEIKKTIGLLLFLYNSDVQLILVSP